jgi:endonuclease YncB( thermonuclease family)
MKITATVVVMLALAAFPVAAQSRPKPQPRATLTRIAVPVSTVAVDDGDTVFIRWKDGDVEVVRILGIDTPETQHLDQNIPYDQSFGPEARAFARGVFANAQKVELLRSTTLDPYDRTLAYVFVDGRNYSVLAVAARVAAESVTQYGDNGLPAEAAAVMAAVKSAGPVPFEDPGLYRARMRRVTEWLKANGLYPR